MALSKEIYQALEDIVGPENISRDVAILDTYAFQNTSELATGGSKFMPRAGAVALPGSTEEVQAIVKTCNRYRIKYRAHSTGWGVWSVPSVENEILLDLRKMDRILEIDEKNNFAVVEPYVTNSTLQAEAMKVGLNTHMIGAGASVSPLAAATSFLGGGPSSISMGYSGQNLLAVEWVMPTGDILRSGSLGSGDGWFCGEGPGPSLRGLMRGFIGAAGALGVYTKCAVKLYPWPGPSVIPVEGTVPAYNALLPKNFRVHNLAFPSYQAYAEAQLKIWDAEIGYILHNQFCLWGNELGPAWINIFSDPTKSVDHLPEMLQKPEIQKLTEEMKISFQIVLAGNTVRDFEYQEKALGEILAETGGRSLPQMQEPAMQKWALLYFLRWPFKSLNWANSGAYAGSFFQAGAPDFTVAQIPVGIEIKKKYIEKGGITNDGANAYMAQGASIGGGSFSYIEMMMSYDPTDAESVKAAKEYQKEAADVSQEKQMGGMTTILGWGYTEEERLARHHLVAQPAIHHWQWKIKQMLDPNDTGDKRYSVVEPPAK